MRQYVGVAVLPWTEPHIRSMHLGTQEQLQVDVQSDISTATNRGTETVCSLHSSKYTAGPVHLAKCSVGPRRK